MARAVGGTAGTDNLVLAAYNDEEDSYYYLFLLGHVNLVPLAYRQAIAYNGVTPVNIGYSATNVTEESIGKSVEYASEYSVTESETLSWEVGVEVGVGNDSTMWHANFTASIGKDYTTEVMNGRSTANTYDTASSKSSEITDEISVTVGDHGEPIGLYRFSMFTTTDVYYVLITDKAQENVTKAYTALCARPTTYWALDYEPELGGSFRKTAPGDLLEIPDLVLSELPTPTDNDLTPIPAEKAATPVANNTTGSYETSVTVSLSTTTTSASIYYTTNGTTPTANSTLYSSPITIPVSCTLKAIAISPIMEPSPVMTETYTITEVPLQTSWTFTISGSNKIIKDDGEWWTDTLYLPAVANGYRNYEPEKLRDAGYAYIKIQGSFQAREIVDGWLRLYIRKGHDHNGPLWFEKTDYDLAAGVSGFQTLNIPASSSDEILIPLNNFDLNFMMTWGADGSGDDDWELGNRTLTFTAVKN
jgi:hypothetical protein